MADASLADIMDALADQIRTALADVTDVAIQVEPRLLINPTPPTIDIYPGDGRDDQSQAFDDVSGGYFISVRARVALGDNIEAQSLLIALMDDADPLSLGYAILSDPHLDGLARIDIRSQTGFVVVQTPGADGALLGCVFTVLAIPTRS